jgi:hypothetical protein
MWPSRRLTRALLTAAVLAALSLGCDVALIGAGVAVVAAGTGMLVAQCYDQVSVRVSDDQGHRTCDAHVSIVSDGSERRLPPCYHASLTEGRYRVTVKRDGYVPADVQVEIPKHEGKCPHYTHTIELTLRRSGAAPDPLHQVKPATIESGAPRAPLPAAAPPSPAAPPAAEPAAPAGPPSAAFPLPPPTPPAPGQPPAPEPQPPAPPK